MRRRLYVMYPVALIVLVWAEFGIIRASLPVHVTTKNDAVATARDSEPNSINWDLIAQARSNSNP